MSSPPPAPQLAADPAGIPASEHTAPAADNRGGGRDSAFVAYLLRLRETNAGARAALRRGEAPALSAGALPYLAGWQLHPAELPAALLFASALARHRDIPDDRSSPLGRAAFQTLSRADRRDPAATGAGRRVVAVQRQSLPMAHRSISGLLTAIAAAPRVGLDWTGLWRSYRNWEDRDPGRRQQTRQRLLLDFYAAGGAEP
jgi:hypothetical protein